nr:DUF4956 domain-containing protein [Prevotella sp.]
MLNLPFMLMSVAIFFLVYFMIFVLEDLKTKTGIGIGIGLFGIFSIMRYRTDAMPVREMTYMFVIIALAVVNAIANSVSVTELLVTDFIVILCIWICERQLKQMPTKLIQYDRIDLIKPEKRAELTKDLTNRLGLDIDHVAIGSVDMLRDMAVIKVYYKEEKGNGDIESKLKLTRDDYTTVE